MANLDIFGKSCNRWPGYSRCLKAVRGNLCAAETEENGGGYNVKCASGQKRKGNIPADLILLLKEGISPCCGEKIFFVKRTGALCCPKCVEMDYCPVCKESIDTENWICKCTKKGIIMPENNRNEYVSVFGGRY